MKTALLLGATGLVGSNLLNQLLADENYGKIVVFSRRSLNNTSEKLKEHLVDFDKIDTWKDLISGDDLFSAMGTTIKKAGSQKAQYLIDKTYPLEVAKHARNNGVKNYALVSSAGADANSKVFYSKMKGELDMAVAELGFSKTVIVKPSIIEGQRNESRLGESIGLRIMKILKYIPGLNKFQPAPAELIAACMIKALNDNSLVDLREFEWNAVMNYAQS
jgi:uncharacterized protein YbjT (DUF2867 family)